MLVDEKNINTKPHKKHVNALTAGDNERFAGRQIVPPQKSFHPGIKRFGDRGVIGDNRVLGCVENFQDVRGLELQGKHCLVDRQTACDEFIVTTRDVACGLKIA